MFFLPCPDGGIGRRARFRSLSPFRGWRFESSSGHLHLYTRSQGGSKSWHKLLIRKRLRQNLLWPAKAQTGLLG